MFLLKRFLIPSHYFFLFSILFQSYFSNAQTLETQLGSKGKQKNAHKIDLKNIILHKGKTVYSEYFEKTEGLIGLQAEKRKNRPVKYTSHVGFSNYKKPPQSYNLGSVKVGGIEMEYDSSIMFYLPEKGMLVIPKTIEPMFGSIVEFSLPPAKRKKPSKKISLYIPLAFDTISIEPSRKSQESPLLKIPTSSFKVKWNPDSHNKNGVLVKIHWFGDIRPNMSSSPRGKKWYTIYDVVEDTGEMMISDKYLNELPKGAVFMIWLVRGEIELIKYDKNYMIKLMGISEIQSTEMFVDEG